jgi:hypothetical protein
MMPGYTPTTIKTASPTSNTTITAPAGTRAWMVTASVQAIYLTTDASLPSSTNGLTLPAGSVTFLPFGGNLQVLNATSGGIVNAIPLT